MSRMREYLYVSSGKLDRFGSPRLRSVKSFSASAAVQPASASLSVTADDRDNWQKTQVKLRQAVRAIGSSVRWYQDDSVRSGDWVRFRGDFGYSILDSRLFRLFLMTQTPTMMQGGVAVLLFGSPGNALLGVPPVPVDVSDLDSYAGNLLTFIRDLVEADTVGQDNPGLGERDQAAVQLFSRISAVHDAIEHVEGVAKTANVIDGCIRLQPPVREERNLQDGDAEPGRAAPSRLIIASALYVATVHRADADRHDVPIQDKAMD
jgi:hypothetical protein